MRKGSKHSEETLQKMRNKKRNIPKETIEKMRIAKTGRNNPMFGREQSSDTCEKIRNALKGKYTGERSPMFGKTKEKHHMYKKHFSEETVKRMRIAKTGERNTFYGKCHSEESKNKNRIAHSGERSSNWKGGTSFFPYCNKFDKRRRKAVREFFNNLCICTGEPQYTKALSVHHIDHDKEQGCNGKPFNLVPMSDSHHSQEQYNKEEYKQYINKTLREGFKWGIWNEQEYMEKVMY
ncbi:MAG: NUMOD3 domain-containing DNA-binding protein [Nitrososphaeraceae archaeon]|nr:NUMOD3 domain-containing DNA-binding protein [Nitrososphaeraceae archaeon]